MKPYCRVFGSAVFFAGLQFAAGQGIILVQHSGFNNPTNEGFTLAGIGSQANVGPVTGGGVDAWNTTVSNVNNNINYVYSLTPLQQSETVGMDWILSGSLQVLESGGGPNAFIGANSFGMYIGSETNGDPFVDGTRSNPVFLLSGGGGGYHNYQLVYTAATGDVALWVDSVERVPALFNEPATGISQISFGEGQGGLASDNWDLVSFETIPEPSPAAFLLLGSGVLFYLHRKSRC